MRSGVPVKNFASVTNSCPACGASQPPGIYHSRGCGACSTTIDVVASDRQEGLPVNYRSPFSIAVGIEYRILEETWVHLAMEWFAPLSTYTVMQPASEDFILNGSTTVKPIDSAELLRVHDSMNDVFNVGVAVEHKLNDKLTGYGCQNGF